MRPIEALAIWILAASLATFGMTVLDKNRARRHGTRIPERTLLTMALLGGSPGLFLGMILVRHKTRKGSFLLGFAAVLVVQAAASWIVLR